MNALILAAGLGTRLGQYTQDRPKALVELDGHTMLEYQLRHLAAAGFDRFVVNTHHFSNLVKEYLEQNRNFGLDLKISDETDLLLDTGGGIRRAMHLFENREPVLVHNVDIFSNTDLKALYMQHIGNACHATLLTAVRNTSRYLYFDSRDRLCGWANVKTGQTRSPHADFKPEMNSPRAFQGIHVLSHDILPWLDSVESPSFSITDFYVDNCDRLKLCGAVSASSCWADAGRPETLPAATAIIEGHYIIPE